MDSRIAKAKQVEAMEATASACAAILEQTARTADRLDAIESALKAIADAARTKAPKGN